MERRGRKEEVAVEYICKYVSRWGAPRASELLAIELGYHLYHVKKHRPQILITISGLNELIQTWYLETRLKIVCK